MKGLELSLAEEEIRGRRKVQVVDKRNKQAVVFECVATSCHLMHLLQQSTLVGG